MPRYPRRGHFHILSIMATMPVQYAFAGTLVGFVLAFPIRYFIGHWFERQEASKQSELKHKAIRFYQEMERMHRRQASVNHTLLNNDAPEHRAAAAMMNESLKQGNSYAEESYWYAHNKDVYRAQQLLGEIRELKAKIQLREQAQQVV